MLSTNTIPHVSVRPNSVTFYNLPERHRSRSKAQIAAQVHLEDNSHKGEMSHKASRSISQGVDWMLYLSKPKTDQHFKSNRRFTWRVNFVTLTLSSPQVHTDQVIKEQLLNQFIIESKLSWGVKQYLWRAESQANGNIHFHIMTDKFIPWKELKNKWNRIQDKLGYVQRSKHFKAGWSPNSTDVHSVRKVKRIGAYLGEYFAKKGKNRAIEGKQWGLSHGLSRMKSATDLRYSEIEDDLHTLFVKKKSQLKVYEWHSTFWVSVDELKELGCGSLVELIEEYSIGKEFENG